MDIKDKAIISATIENMFATTKTDWTTGDSEKWSKWGSKMRTSIQDNVHVLQKLIECPTESNEGEILKLLTFLEAGGHLASGTAISDVMEDINDNFEG